MVTAAGQANSYRARLNVHLGAGTAFTGTAGPGSAVGGTADTGLRSAAH